MIKVKILIERPQPRIIRLLDSKEIVACGENIKGAYLMAKDVLKFCSSDLYEDGKKIIQTKRKHDNTFLVK